jgi:hypothetical protein
MRSYLLAFALVAACGGSNSSTNNGDANNGGDGTASGDSLGGSPSTVTVTLTNQPATPATYSFLAAYQDGAGAWQLAPAPSGDTYTLTINAPVWGFAWTCIVPNSNPVIARVELAYFTVAEKTSLTESIPVGCTDRIMNAGVGGTVANLQNGGNGYRVSFDAANRAVMTIGTFGVETPPGMHDLFITHAGGTGGRGPVDGAVRATATAPASGVALDWNTQVATVATTVTAPQGAFVTTTLYSSGGTQVSLGASAAAGNVGSTLVTSLGTSQGASGDIYSMSATTIAQGASATSEVWANAPSALTFTAPAALGGATSAVASQTPYPIIMTTWNAYANAIGYAWDIKQGQGGSVGGASPLEWTAIVGPGYVGASPKFQMPDLSTLTGWSAAYQPTTGNPVLGTVGGTTSSAGAADFPTVNPAPNGTTRTLVTSGWTVTP